MMMEFIKIVRVIGEDADEDYDPEVDESTNQRIVEEQLLVQDHRSQQRWNYLRQYGIDE